MENLSSAKDASRKFDRKRHLTYTNMLWLFVAASLLGTAAEGFHSLFKFGHWETHVVALGLPLCILYGLGAVGCYIGHCLLPRRNLAAQFVVYLIVGTVIELVSGALLEYGLGMRAWNYLYKPLNFRGYICLSASVGWGFVGILFSLLLARPIDAIFSKLGGRLFRILTVLLTVYLIVDFLLTGVCLWRWSRRHFGKFARTPFSRFIDNAFPDSFMRKRFVEWSFLH